MPNATLSNRLMTAVGFVRRGSVFADIGTDHAHLPIYLYKNNMVKKAIAADVNPMPLEIARKNISLNSAQKGIETVLSDGLDRIKEYSPDDIAIFGMGGELICRIISDAEWTKNNSVRLILQPMTKQEDVRRFLLDNGYSIIGEAVSYDDGKFYQTICAEYSGENEKYSEAELILGKHNIKNGGVLFSDFVKNRIEVYKNRQKGKMLVGLGEEEEKLISEFEKILEETE